MLFHKFDDENVVVGCGDAAWVVVGFGCKTVGSTFVVFGAVDVPGLLVPVDVGAVVPPPVAVTVGPVAVPVGVVG